MKTRKDYNKSAVNSWIDSCITHNAVYVGHAIRNHVSKGGDLEKMLARMSSSDLKMLSCCFASIYTLGCNETRENLKAIRKSKEGSKV